MTNIILIEPLQNKSDLALLESTGMPVVCLTDVRPNRPHLWSSLETSGWMNQALEELKYDPSLDYIALTGNYLALAQLIACVAVRAGNPYRINCLAYARSNGVAKYQRISLLESESET